MITVKVTASILDQDQHDEGEQAEQALDDRKRPNRAVGLQPATNVADAEEQPLQRQSGGEPQGCKAGFGDHLLSVCPALCSAVWLPSSGGM